MGVNAEDKCVGERFVLVCAEQTHKVSLCKHLILDSVFDLVVVQPPEGVFHALRHSPLCPRRVNNIAAYGTSGQTHINLCG